MKDFDIRGGAINLVSGLIDLAGRDTRHSAWQEQQNFVCAFVTREVERAPAISLPAANLLVVLEGTKTIRWGGGSSAYRPGEAFVMPPGACLDVVNIPDRRTGIYRALLIGFSAQSLREVAHRWRPHSRPVARTDPRVTLNPTLASAILHTCAALSGRIAASPLVRDQRTLEILLLLAEQGAAPVPAPIRPGDAATVLARLVAGRPDHDWTVSAVAKMLDVSQSTLRRRLRAENTSFRALVMQARMCAAHAMLEQGHEVTEAALTAGYASLSHFARRFAATYGCLPSRVCRKG